MTQRCPPRRVAQAPVQEHWFLYWTMTERRSWRKPTGVDPHTVLSGGIELLWQGGVCKCSLREIGLREVGVWLNVRWRNVVAVRNQKIILCHTTVLTTVSVMKIVRAVSSRANTHISDPGLYPSACALSKRFLFDMSFGPVYVSSLARETADGRLMSAVL